MLALLLLVAIIMGNFALGFGLAIWLGHGPAGASLSNLQQRVAAIRSGRRPH